MSTSQTEYRSELKKSGSTKSEAVRKPTLDQWFGKWMDDLDTGAYLLDNQCFMNTKHQEAKR